MLIEGLQRAQTSEVELDDRAVERADLIKRLFAVTLSVGFASQLNGLIGRAISGGHLPVWPLLVLHWREMALLVVSIVAVVGSWEGYLSSIGRNPLRDRIRFYVDILIVFAYLVLMLTCQAARFWFGTLATIFGLYAVWDICTERYCRKFGVQVNAPEPIHANSIAITLLWFPFFVALATLDHVDSDSGFAFATFAALVAVVLYRVDKEIRVKWRFKVALLLLPVMLLIVSARS